MEAFEYYLIGRHFTALTDHKPLQALNSTLGSNPVYKRWRNRMARFDFHVRYIKGVDNYLPDALSRLYTDACVESTEPPDQAPLPPWMADADG